MTRSDLEAKLKSERIDPVTYDLVGVGKDEAYCLEQTGSRWSVCYRERGNRNREQMFGPEAEAREYILKKILKDPTTCL